MLRQVEPSAVARNSLTLELYFDGSAKLFVPLLTVQPLGTMGSVAEWIQSTAVRDVLSEYAQQDRDHWGIDLARFFDVQRFWATIAILVNFYRDWLGEQTMLADIKVAIGLSEIWRSVAFVDDDEWAGQVRKLGMPVIMQSVMSMPAEEGTGVVEAYDELLWFHICSVTTAALGLSPELFARAIVKAGEQNGGTA